jgi:hypothetical protein
MALAANSAFAHRQNANGKVDSICLRCFQTISTADSTNGLRDSEEAHRCGGFESGFVIHPEYQRQETLS